MEIKKTMTLEEILAVFGDAPFMLQTDYITLYNLTSDMFKIKKYDTSRPAHQIEYRAGNVYFLNFNIEKLKQNRECATVSYQNTRMKIKFEALRWDDLSEFE